MTMLKTKFIWLIASEWQVSCITLSVFGICHLFIDSSLSTCADR